MRQQIPQQSDQGIEASSGQSELTDQGVPSGAVPLGSRWTFWCDT